MMLANARSVNVNRTDLLAKLVENRDKHAAEYKTAMLGYQLEVFNKLDEAFRKMQTDNSSFDGGLSLEEIPPQDHTTDYDLAIKMMEMSTDETIHMDSNSFNQYVMDNWSWKQVFAATTSKYMNNVVAGAAAR